MPPTPVTSRNLASRSDEQLLDTRFCDLPIRIQGELSRRIRRLYAELDDKGLTSFRPHCWLSNEWFSPDGIPGIAVPFYLAHPRLMKLERSRMLSVEGGSESHCLRILRHEAGHCIDTAYRLNRRKRYRQLFGRYSDPYPDTYKPRPGSRNYVTHLDGWYAQSHPAEDFAETFAVWLTPSSRWKSHYKLWPAMRKLQFVDEVMAEVAELPPPVWSETEIEPLRKDRGTLREHYRDKQMRYGDEFPDFYDVDLLKLFSAEPKYRGRMSASAFLREVRPELRDDVSRWTGAHAYTIDQVLQDMIDRSRELKLRLKIAQPRAKKEATMMLTVQTMSYMLAGHHPVAL